MTVALSHSQRKGRTAQNSINGIIYKQIAATEIRCQEKSKGGLSYEVILAEPTVTTPVPSLKRSGSSASKATSAEEIEEKLKAAEERRLVRKDAGCVIIVRGMEIKVLGTSMVKGARGENPSGMDGEGGQDRRGVPQEGRIQFVVH